MSSPQQYELEQVTKWLGVMQERGIFNTNTARLRTTAVEQLATILGDDEPKTVNYMAENIETIATRWAVKKSANPDTAAAYRSRAKVALDDFLTYQSNPTGFKPKVRAVNGDGAAKKVVADKEKPAATPATETAQLPFTPPAAQATQPNRSYPLGGTTEFWYRLPETGLTVSDVARITCHLITMAKDFDPMGNKEHAAFFQLSAGQK